MKVKIFRQKKQSDNLGQSMYLEERINVWLEENTNIIVSDIKQSESAIGFCISGRDFHCSLITITIWYKEK